MILPMAILIAVYENISSHLHLSLSFFVQNDFRLGTIAAIFTHKQIIIICNKPVAPVTIWFLKLITKIDFGIVKQFYAFPVGEGIFQIDICAA